LHAELIASSGGSSGVRDLGRTQAALAQPMATFDGAELYPDIAEKAGALGFALIQGHPFIDGNKRIGHAALEIFLVLNGFEVVESIDEQERTILSVASGELLRGFTSPGPRVAAMLDRPQAVGDGRGFSPLQSSVRPRSGTVHWTAGSDRRRWRCRWPRGCRLPAQSDRDCRFRRCRRCVRKR
jgi:death on curing protein